MVPLAIFVATFALIPLGPGGWVLMVLCWIVLGGYCACIYTDALSRYWKFRQTERAYSVLALKRMTILQEILRHLGRWPQYEKDIIGLVAGTTESLAFLNQRFPNLQSYGFVQRYLSELTQIETEINRALTRRVSEAARYLEMLDNSLINCVVPRREVPADLIGWLRDTRVPAQEVRNIMDEHQYSGTHPQRVQSAGATVYTPNSFPTALTTTSLVIGISAGAFLFLVLLVLALCV